VKSQDFTEETLLAKKTCTSKPKAVEVHGLRYKLGLMGPSCVDEYVKKGNMMFFTQCHGVLKNVYRSYKDIISEVCEDQWG